MAGSPFGSGHDFIAAALSPNGSFLYGTTGLSTTPGAVQAFTINSTTGALTAVGSAVSSGGNDISYAIHASGTGPFPSNPQAYVTSAANSLAQAIGKE